MTSGFSTIAGSVLAAYINLGVPPQNLVTSSVMSIPASLAISKLRMPETEVPVTRGHVTIDRGEDDKHAPVSNRYIHALPIANSTTRPMPSMPSVKVLFSVSLSLDKFCKPTRCQRFFL